MESLLPLDRSDDLSEIKNNSTEPPVSASDEDGVPIASSARMQRSRGVGRLVVKSADGRSRIERLFQEGSAKIRLPKQPASAPLEAVMINTSGGLTGGDRLDWQIGLAAGARLVATTQACEKVYKSTGSVAEVETTISMAQGAELAWLPQETIIYNRSGLKRRLTVRTSSTSRVLVVEPLIFGRQAMGENVETAVFHDSWRVFEDGHLIHAEEFKLGPDVGTALHKSPVLNGNRAMATVLLVDRNAEDFAETVTELVGEFGGVSAWRTGKGHLGKLLARLVAKDGYDLRKRLVPVLELLNKQASLPKVWSL